MHQKSTVLVHPKVLKLRPDILQSINSSEPYGQHSGRHGQGGDDYCGLREFASGDRLGDIAWKVSARRGELVCVQRSRPSLSRIRVILDLTTPTKLLHCDKDARLLEEDAIALCASLLVEAVLQEQEVGLTILGFPSLEDSGMQSGKRQLNRLFASLSRIDLDASRDLMRIETATNRKKIGLVVIRPDSAWSHHTSRDVKCFSGTQLAELQSRVQRSESA